MRYLTLNEVLDLYRQVIEQSGGEFGIQNLGALESAIAQPRMTFDSKELYSTIVEKASSLCFTIIMNHPFIDGNKRTGHAAMEIFLVLNGFEIKASVEEQEKIILQLAEGKLSRNAFTNWLGKHIVKKL